MSNSQLMMPITTAMATRATNAMNKNAAMFSASSIMVSVPRLMTPLYKHKRAEIASP